MDINIQAEDAQQIWAILAEEGKAPSELTFASQVLPAYSVGIDPWIERLTHTYLLGLCRKQAHFKIVIAPYGGGKTHFLMSLGSRALTEGYAVAYVACTQGIDLNNSLDLYRIFIKALQIPGEDRPGIKRLLNRIIQNKMKQIEVAGAPDSDIAFNHWLGNVASDEHQESAFGRIIGEALRAEYEPSQAVAGDAPLRWLRGEIDTLTKEELAALRLAKYPAKTRNELGRNLIISVARFAREAGVLGVVILFDEAETMFNATGKALLKVLSAMRVMIDSPGGVHGGVPLFGVFSAVPDILEQLGKYQALDQRLMVRGVSFEEGGNFAPQLHLDKVQSQEDLLYHIGQRLIELGNLATGHSFDHGIQESNLKKLSIISAERNLQIDARRLFVKTWVNILDAQVGLGERKYTEEELSDRYRGFFDNLRQSEQKDTEP
jgi:hypothetical protein